VTLCDSHALVIAHPCSTRWQMLTNTRSVNRRVWPRGFRLGCWGGRRTSNSTLFVSSAVTVCGPRGVCFGHNWKRIYQRNQRLSVLGRLGRIFFIPTRSKSGTHTYIGMGKRRPKRPSIKVGPHLSVSGI
jgi:hypothetical protein